jgi:hypothetical protein
MGAIGPSDFSRQANGYGQASGDHASSRTDPTTLSPAPPPTCQPRRRCRRSRRSRWRDTALGDQRGQGWLPRTLLTSSEVSRAMTAARVAGSRHWPG